MIRRLTSGSEPRRPGPAVHRGQIAVAVDPQAVAHAIEAGEVRRRLGRGDQVVGRERVRRVRQPARLDRGAQVLGAGRAWPRSSPGRRARRRRRRRSAPPGRPAGYRAGPQRVGSSIVPGNATEVESRGSRPDHVPEQQRGVGDIARQRPGLVKRGGKGDHPVARAGAVGRLQTDDPAQRRGLADRPAGVGSDRPRREARGDRRGAAARGSAGHALRSQGLSTGP